MDLAFQYIINNGLCSSLKIYTAEDGICDNTCQSLVKISNYSDVIPGQEKDVNESSSTSTESIAIQANKRSFKCIKGVFILIQTVVLN